MLRPGRHISPGFREAQIRLQFPDAGQHHIRHGRRVAWGQRGMQPAQPRVSLPGTSEALEQLGVDPRRTRRCTGQFGGPTVPLRRTRRVAQGVQVDVGHFHPHRRTVVVATTRLFQVLERSRRLFLNDPTAHRCRRRFGPAGPQPPLNHVIGENPRAIEPEAQRTIINGRHGPDQRPGSRHVASGPSEVGL